MPDPQQIKKISHGFSLQPFIDGHSRRAGKPAGITLTNYFQVLFGKREQPLIFATAF
jgi:hypothetical protein